MSPSTSDLHREGRCLSEGVGRHRIDQIKQKMLRLPGRGRGGNHKNYIPKNNQIPIWELKTDMAL